VPALPHDARCRAMQSFLYQAGQARRTLVCDGEEISWTGLPFTMCAFRSTYRVAELRGHSRTSADVDTGRRK